MDELIANMKAELASMRRHAENEIGSSIRAECRDEARGFAKALKMVIEANSLQKTGD